MISTNTTIVDRRSQRELRRTICLGTRDSPGLCDGQLILTQKGGDRRYASITEFVCAQTDATVAEWKAALGLAAELSNPFAGQVIEVEDASPDCCLGLLALALRLSGQALSARWIEYAHLWELGDVHTTGDAAESFGALQSALTHAEFKAGGADVEALDRAFRLGMAYAEGLVRVDADPAKLPRTLGAPANDQLHALHRRAHACLAFEHTIYRRVIESATKVQLAVDLAPGPTDEPAGVQHRTLVDGLIFSEVELTGALKVFARTDRTSPSGNGYALMALHRPDEAMTGNDMSVSVDPTSHLSLAALWRELELREEAAWSAFAATPGGRARPRDKVRSLVSHGRLSQSTAPSNEPWWDDHGRVTLVAAPRAVECDGKTMPGTRLGWSDVKAALWACYAPEFGLRVRPRGSTAEGGSLLKLRDSAERLDGDSGPVLADLERTAGQHPLIAVWSPTLAAACAAQLDGASVRIDALPPPDAYDMVEGRGGIVVVARGGVMLLALNQDGAFPAAELKRAVSEVATTLASVARIETMRSEKGSGIRDLVRKAVQSGGNDDKREALRKIYHAKLAVREAWDTAQSFETDSLVRRVRESCEARWGARERLDRVVAEIEELEEMVVSSSGVRSDSLLNLLAIYALPASVFGNLLGGLLILEQGNYQGVSIAVITIYLGLVAIFSGALWLLSWRTTQSWRLDR